MNDVAIRVENLSKRYRINRVRQRYHTLRDEITDSVRSLFRRNGRGHEEEETFWALRDVSFEVKRGEVIGIIGRNGAGKSTLLKILSRITEPTRGRATIHGRVGSLLEVGTGFHGELSGRENIYLNGAMLGMRKAEIDRKFDEIVGFSELENFIDTPVKRYSSGMYVRLAFAVAAHLEPEIVIVDEVLAVGDVAFQKKCLGKMEGMANQGRTLLFVSHNMAAIQALCSRGICISAGLIAADGPILDVIRAYSSEVRDVSSQRLAERSDRRGRGQLRFSAHWIENSEGERIDSVLVGQDVRFCFAYKATEPLRRVHASFILQGQMGEPIINCDTGSVGQDFDEVPKEGVIVCELKKFPLRAFRYDGNVYCEVQKVIADWVHSAFAVDVMEGDFYGTGKLPNHGKVFVPQRWSVRKIENSIDEELLIEQRELDGEESERLFERINASVITRTMDGRINFWNRSAEELYGWRKEEAIGKVSHSLLQTQFPSSLHEIESALVRMGRWEGKLVHATRNGGRVTVQSRWLLNFKRRPGAVVEINTRSADC
jgi:lipopolysaccharide transport system ATP-binding protein